MRDMYHLFVPDIVKKNYYIILLKVSVVCYTMFIDNVKVLKRTEELDLCMFVCCKVGPINAATSGSLKSAIPSCLI